MTHRGIVFDGFTFPANGRRIASGAQTALSISLILFFAWAASADTKHPPAHSVDLNTAAAEQLQQVPGIGPSTARAIVDFRQKSGPFRRVEDLLAIKGISKARLEKMRPYLTIGLTPPKAP